MKQIYEQVKNCERCPNVMHCKKTGMEPAIMMHLDAKIMFLALNPGVPLDSEKGLDYDTVLFNSRMGKQFLQKFMISSGYRYEDIVWNNICKCPTDNNREITDEEIDNCFEYLKEQLKSLKNLKYVVLLGNKVKEYIIKHPIETEAKIISMVHPAYIFRTGQYKLIDELVVKIKEEHDYEITQIQTKFNMIREYYRINGVKYCKEIDFENYFYVKESDFRNVVAMIRHETAEFDIKYETNHVSIYGDKLVKIYPKKYDFWKVKKLMKNNKIQTYEFDVDVYLKYLLHSKKKFTTRRKVGIIDIETDMSLDVVNTPKAITAITIYDYDTDKYYTWIWNDKLTPNNRIKTNEVLYFFNDEISMMSDFMDKLREFDYDILANWNGENFDLPYIINRVRKIGLNPNNLSNWGEVEFRPFQIKGRDYAEVVIPGTEIVDMIPVLKKNTCYSKQPVSWSLFSVTKFYLKNDVKLIELGPDMWKKDIDLFITYNIKDVELVKKIIDKFMLVDFLYVIQLETAPCPLRHTTHNSIVLLYYLKLNYPNYILPDNIGEFILDKDIVNLFTNEIKIKAAHVIPAKEGIHEHVYLWDVRGLYPSIIMTFNMSPDTINDDEGVEVKDIEMWTLDDKKAIMKSYNFSKKFKKSVDGVYPMMLKDLTNKRNYHKDLYKKFKKEFGEEDSRTMLEMFRQDVKKQQNNSLFGINCFDRFNIFNPHVGAAITSVGRSILQFAEEYLEKKCNYKVITGDTDSVFFSSNNKINVEEFEQNFNLALKEWVLKTWDIDESRYCLYFEYGNYFKKFVMKAAKKKYYAILENGDFYVKGFDIVTHSISTKIKIILQDIYTMLINRCSTSDIKNKLAYWKKEFIKYKAEDIGIEWKITNNIEDYTTSVRHIRAADYSNKYLGTDFKAGTVGKLIFIKNSNDIKKYPKTDILLLDEKTKLPSTFEIDYEIAWEKLILDKIRLLDDIEEMNINQLLSKNKSIWDYK